MIIVIADDITGAAEIAGIAARHKLKTQLLIEGATMRATARVAPTIARTPTDVVVVATDTRSASESEAVETMRDIGTLVATLNPKPFVFKKTDSVLRGHIMAETRALMDVMGYDSALLIPQNPSKDRVIRKGVYYIKGEELSATAFRHDPEFPATTSDVCKRLIGARSLALDDDMTGAANHNAAIVGAYPCGRPPIGNAADRVCIADAASSEEIRRQISKAGSGTLIVGAADCFEAAIGNEELRIKNEERSTLSKVGEAQRSQCSAAETLSTFNFQLSTLLVVCGSTQSRSLRDEPYIRQIGAEEIGMPEDVFHGGDAAGVRATTRVRPYSGRPHTYSPHTATGEWMSRLERSYSDNGSLVMTIGQPSTGGKDYAVRLRNLMSEAAARLVNIQRPQCIIIEGGATAYALLDRLGWQSFDIRGEIAPGVVCMTYGYTDIILKPGSYPWGEMFES